MRLLLASVLLVLISGCINQTPTCNKPYILVGNDCCLDENGDSICDRDKQLTSTTRENIAETSTTAQTTFAEKASTTAQTPVKTTTKLATASTVKTSTTRLLTSSTLKPAGSDDITVVYRYRHGAGYIWSYKVPGILGYDEAALVNIEINNSKNNTFHLHIQDPKQTDRCWESPKFTDCLEGVKDYNSIRTANVTHTMTGNWSIAIANRLDGSSYTVKWTFLNPSADTRNVWNAWNTDHKGCLYYDNNGSTCEINDFRRCYREDLSVCTQKCCKLTDHRKDKNLTEYRRCYSVTEFYMQYNRWPFVYEITNIPEYYIWDTGTRFKDNNCQDPYRSG